MGGMYTISNDIYSDQTTNQVNTSRPQIKFEINKKKEKNHHRLQEVHIQHHDQANVLRVMRVSVCIRSSSRRCRDQKKKEC